jgi:hypothetical protein
MEGFNSAVKGLKGITVWNAVFMNVGEREPVCCIIVNVLEFCGGEGATKHVCIRKHP